MLKYPCLVLDHDDTVVQSEKTINYPYFETVMKQLRPEAVVTLQTYTEGCFHLGFANMCRQWYGFSEEELSQEFEGWKRYIRNHIPAPYPGIGEIIHRQKALGGKICVVSHSCEENIARDYMTHFGILPDDIFGWDYPEEQRKPHPYPLQRIMDKYHFCPEELLVVDDMKPAYEMAKAGGTAIAFAAWGRQDYPEVMKEMRAICDYAFDAPEQLKHFLFDDLTDVI